MKAIDRAAYWAEMLEQAGFDIECETEINVIGNEMLTVLARKDNQKILFSIQMDSKFTRFITGATGIYRYGQFTRRPSRMSVWISSEIEYADWKSRQEVSA